MGARFYAILGLIILVTFVGVYEFGRARELTRSLDRLMNTHLGLSYVVEGKSLDSVSTDREGLWWILLSHPPGPTVLALEPRLTRADEADLDYYRNRFVSRFNPPVALDDYVLYRGEMTFGKGSICAELPCNVVLLLRFGDTDVFVEISEI